MISFIVIGKNEGWKLSKCFKSVFETIECNKLTEYELIYVDSNSTDDSVERAKQFNEIKIFKLTGVCNAAIGRNIGARESKGNILFFIDGDMEIVPEFLPSIFDKTGNLKYDSVTGHLNDSFFSTDANFITEQPRTYKSQIPPNEIELITSGGILIIKRMFWKKIGGMRTKYKKSQDMDLILRLRSIGVKTVRIPFLIAVHNTVDYRNVNRMWNILFNGHMLYSAVLLRDHFFNKRFFVRSLRQNYTSIVLLFTVLLSITLKSISFPIIIYLSILGVRVYFNTKSAIKNNKYNYSLLYYIQRFIFQALRDISFPLSFLFYYPTSYDLEDIQK